MKIDKIIEIVCDVYNISYTELIGFKRLRIYTEPRFVAIMFCRDYTDLTLKKIAFAFCKRDHSTIIHAIKECRNSIEQDYYNIENIEKIECLIKQLPDEVINEKIEYTFL